jgi:hypothetical protein
MRVRAVIIFVLLGVVCASISATLADAWFGGPNVKTFLDLNPHEIVSRAGGLRRTWRFPGVTYTADVEMEEQRDRFTSQVSAGWPFRSFGARHFYDIDRGVMLISPYRFHRAEPKIAGGGFRVYLLPLWGLIPNTLVYACGLALAWRWCAGLRQQMLLRRQRRAYAASVCCECGYPIENFRVCPECGKAVNEASTS